MTRVLHDLAGGSASSSNERHTREQMQQHMLIALNDFHLSIQIR